MGIWIVWYITFCIRNVLLGLLEDACFIIKIIMYGKDYILKCKYQDTYPCIESYRYL